MQSDSASVNGYTLYAWHESVFSSTSSGQLRQRLVDSTTGRAVGDLSNFGADAGLTTDAIVRCLAVGNSLCLGWVAGSLLTIYTFDTANNFKQHTFTTSVLTASKLWDWSVVTNGSGTQSAFVACQTAATQLAFFTISNTATQILTSSFTTSTTVTQLGVVQSYPGAAATSYNVIYTDSTKNISLIPLTTALVHGTVTANSDGANIQVPFILTGQQRSTGLLYIFVGSASSLTPPAQITTENDYYIVNTSGTFNGSGVTAPQTRQLGLCIASKPIYVDDGNTYFWTLYPSVEQGQYILLHRGTWWNAAGQAFSVTGAAGCQLSPAARILAGTSMGNGQGGAPTICASNVSNPAAGIYETACGIIGSNVSSVTGFYQVGGTGKLRADFNFTNAYPTATLNGQMVIGGGFNALYNGACVTELGFFIYPENVTAVAHTTGGTLGVGLYQYAITYEWQDEQRNPSPERNQRYR